jgi:hypothetical protein
MLSPSAVDEKEIHSWPTEQQQVTAQKAKGIPARSHFTTPDKKHMPSILGVAGGEGPTHAQQAGPLAFTRGHPVALIFLFFFQKTRVTPLRKVP